MSSNRFSFPFLNVFAWNGESNQSTYDMKIQIYNIVATPINSTIAINKGYISNNNKDWYYSLLQISYNIAKFQKGMHEQKAKINEILEPSAPIRIANKYH
jgi:hypothetical protein